MEYGELIETAKANLITKDILKNYLREGPETGFGGRFNLRYFERFGFKFRMTGCRGVSEIDDKVLVKRDFSI